VSDLCVRDPMSPPAGRGVPPEDWRYTPPSVRQPVLTLLKRVEALAARLHRDASTSSRPPSTASSTKTRQRRRHAAERRKPGAKRGPPGHQQGLWEPPARVSGFPEPWACGHREFSAGTLSHTPQVIA
jgi:hypothetical protein